MASIKLARYKFVSKMLSSDDEIIDIGCGGGLSTLFFSKFCKHALGVDNDESRIPEWNKIKNKQVRFLKQDVKNINAINSTANCIINIDFIEHFDKEDGIKIIKNCKNYLHTQENKRNKMFIIGTPSFYSKKYRAPHNLKNHKYEYKPDELNEICKKFFSRTLNFTMNDELVHTGFDKLGWYFFIICFV